MSEAHCRLTKTTACTDKSWRKRGASRGCGGAVATAAWWWTAGRPAPRCARCAAQTRLAPPPGSRACRPPHHAAAPPALLPPPCGHRYSNICLLYFLMHQLRSPYNLKESLCALTAPTNRSLPKWRMWLPTVIMSRVGAMHPQVAGSNTPEAALQCTTRANISCTSNERLHECQTLLRSQLRTEQWCNTGTTAWTREYLP